MSGTTKKKPTIYSRLRSAIRREWLYSELRKNAMTQARVSRGIYRCSHCSSLVGPKLIEVDHIIHATPEGGIQDPKDFGLFIERLLFCGPNGVIALCKPCHQDKTNRERNRTKKKVFRKTKIVHYYIYYNFKNDFLYYLPKKLSLKSCERFHSAYIGVF